MYGYNTIGRRIYVPERTLEPDEPAAVCECSRCRQDVYQDECTYEDGLGQALCRECFEDLLHERIRHELPLLAQELGYDVVRHV